MSRNFFDFGDHSAVVGALAVLVFALGANFAYFVVKDFANKAESRERVDNQQVYQGQQKAKIPEVKNESR